MADADTPQEPYSPALAPNVVDPNVAEYLDQELHRIAFALVGIKGIKGDTGDTGADGAKGDTGDTGDTGAQGAQGNPGTDGTDGTDGANGIGVEVGTIMTWPTNSAPNPDWLRCEGFQVQTADYPDLFAVIGYDYGGSGAFFNIPDYRGRFVRARDAGAGLDPDAATRNDRGDGTTGDNTGTVQGHELLAHNHTAGNSVTGGTTGGTVRGTGIGSVATSTTGGSETRARNIYATFIILARVPSAVTILPIP